MSSCPRGLSGLQLNAVDQMGDRRMGTLAFPTGVRDLSINCPLFYSSSLPTPSPRPGAEKVAGLGVFPSHGSIS